MKKMQEEKREQILRLDGVEGSGLAPTTVPPTTTLSNATTATTNIHATVGIGQTTTTTPWASNALPSAVAVPLGNGYGSAAQPSSQISQPSYAYQQKQQEPSYDSGFGFMQSSSQSSTTMQSSIPQYSNNLAQQQQYPHQPVTTTSQQLSHQRSVFDPFDAIAGPSVSMTSSSSSGYAPTAYTPTAPATALPSGYDPNSISYSNTQQNGSGGSLALSDADMNLFKF